MQVYNRTQSECFDGDVDSNNNTCTDDNSAPVCKAINANTMVRSEQVSVCTF